MRRFNFDRHNLFWGLAVIFVWCFVVFLISCFSNSSNVLLCFWYPLFQTSLMFLLCFWCHAFHICLMFCYDFDILLFTNSSVCYRNPSWAVLRFVLTTFQLKITIRFENNLFEQNHRETRNCFQQTQVRY